MYDALRRTLVDPFTFDADMRIADNYRVAPCTGGGCSRTQVVVPYSQGCSSNRTYNPITLIPRGRCLSLDTIFPVDSTFSIPFTFPPGNSPIYETTTQSEPGWSTDIKFGQH